MPRIGQAQSVSCYFLARMRLVLLAIGVEEKLVGYLVDE